MVDDDELDNALTLLLYDPTQCANVYLLVYTRMQKFKTCELVYKTCMNVLDREIISRRFQILWVLKKCGVPKHVDRMIFSRVRKFEERIIHTKLECVLDAFLYFEKT